MWVVVFHLGWETFGAILPVFRNPVSAAFNGSLAVTIFFVLSGEALSSGFFSGRGRTQVVGLAVKRIPRLSIPACFALLLTFTVARLGLAHNLPAAAHIVNRPDWLGHMHPNAITVRSLIKFPLIDMYVGAFPDFDHLPFLWTMNTEMIGSLLVFIVLLCWAELRYREFGLLGLGGILLLNYPAANLADFCFGVFLSHWRHQGALTTFARFAWVRWSAPAGIVAMLAASSVAAHWRIDQRVAPVIAPALVACVFLWPPAMRGLSMPLSRLLGRLSFPLYLVHYAVIITFTSSAIVWVTRERLDADHALVILLASLAICLAAAGLFTPVETLTRKVGQRIGRLLVRTLSSASAELPASRAASGRRGARRGG